MDRSAKSSPYPFRWHTLLLLSLILLGGYLRLKDLGEESLWNDELESWRQSSFDTVGQVISEGVRPDTHPPGFQVVLFLVEKTFGASEVDLRLPSAVSGILSIAVVYALGKEHLSEGAALIAALLLAVMWAPIAYSQEARNYALVMLLVTAASHFWMKIVRHLEAAEHLDLRLLSSYCLCAAACAYAHYFGLLVVGLQATFLLAQALVRRRNMGTIMALYVGIGLLYAPWLPSMIEQLSHTERISWIQQPELTALPAYFSFAFGRLRWLGLLAILAYVWLFGWMLIGRRRGGVLTIGSLLTAPEGMLFYWLLAPLIVTYLISILWTPVFTQRNLLVCLPAAYLLFGRAAERLPVRWTGQAAIALGVAGVALYNLFVTMGYYRFDQKEQFREVVRYVVERHPGANGPPIVGYSRFPVYFDYYFERFGSDLRVDLSAGENADVEQLLTFLAEEEPARLWFLSAHRKPDDGFMQALVQEYTVLDQRSFVMAEVRLLGRAER